jgi:8-oxo-dGTP diphosphatase
MTAEPADKATRIGIAVVEHEGRYLVGTRGPDGPLAGYSEFPGGKCQADETPAATAIRECFEETGLRVEIVELLLELEFDYSHGRVDLRFFLCRPVADSDVTALGASFTWIPAQWLSERRFPDANAPVIAKLIERARWNSAPGSA